MNICEEEYKCQNEYQEKIRVQECFDYYGNTMCYQAMLPIFQILQTI